MSFKGLEEGKRLYNTLEEILFDAVNSVFKVETDKMRCLAGAQHLKHRERSQRRGNPSHVRKPVAIGPCIVKLFPLEDSGARKTLEREKANGLRLMFP